MNNTIEDVLSYRHLQLLQMQAKIEDAYKEETTINYFIDNPENYSLIPEPTKINLSDLSTDNKRLLYISRLQAARKCESMGHHPWKLKFNHAYQVSQQPCISVIVTLYNYSSYIQECLDSVSQSEIANLPGNIEIIVVDDCSTDNSANLVEEYLEKSHLPICLVKKWFNTGLADARNIGLKLAHSPYVFILDADNWIYPNCLSILYHTINSSKYAAVYGEIRKFDDKTKEELNIMSCDEWDINKLVKHPYIDAMAMFNKNAVLKLGGYSTELIEYGWFGWDDYDLWLKLALANYSCKLVPKVLSSYRVHSSSMINTTNLYALNIAKYFHIKFAKLAKKYTLQDCLFGFTKQDVYSCPSPTGEDEQSKIYYQELQTAYMTIKAMKSSKFWQLRNLWFKLKKLLGLARDININI